MWLRPRQYLSRHSSCKPFHDPSHTRADLIDSVENGWWPGVAPSAKSQSAASAGWATREPVGKLRVPALAREVGGGAAVVGRERRIRAVRE